MEWVWQQSGWCGCSHFGVTAVGWVWQLVRICQVGVGAKVEDVVEESRLFK